MALAAYDAPRTLVSASYHIAALTHPDPVVAWAAVAVNVALARFLQGKRDFVPDVIEALRNNAVPEELLAAVRRVPLPARDVSCPRKPPGRARRSRTRRPRCGSRTTSRCWSAASATLAPRDRSRPGAPGSPAHSSAPATGSGRFPKAGPRGTTGTSWEPLAVRLVRVDRPRRRGTRESRRKADQRQ